MFSTLDNNKRPKPCFSAKKLLSFFQVQTRYFSMEEFLMGRTKTPHKDTVSALRYKAGSTVVVIKTLLTFTYSTLYYKMSSNQT